MTMKQTTYIVIEVTHHGDAKKISELTAQAAYSLSSVDNARVLTFGAEVARPDAVLEVGVV